MALNNVIRQQRKRPDGSTEMVFVDSKTGQTVGQPQVLDSGTIMDLKTLGIDPVSSPSSVPQIKPKVLPKQGTTEQGSGNEQTGKQTFAGAFNKDASNNFGYVNKPDWMSYVSLIPGIGRFAKAADIGIGVNNLAAVNTSREMLGLDKANFRESLGQVFGDQKGYVGDVNIGENRYAVGLEAQDKLGRTTLTPNEARQRAGFMNEDISEATKEQVQASKEDFKAQGYTPEQRGLGIRDQISEFAQSVVDKLFGKSSNNGGIQSTPKTAPVPSNLMGTTPDRGEAPTTGSSYDSVGTPTNNDAPWGGPR